MKQVKDIQPLYAMIAENQESLNALSTYNKYYNDAFNKAQEEIVKKYLDEFQFEPYIQDCGDGLYKVTASKDWFYYTNKLGAEQASEALKTAIKDLTK